MKAVAHMPMCVPPAQHPAVPHYPGLWAAKDEICLDPSCCLPLGGRPRLRSINIGVGTVLALDARPRKPTGAIPRNNLVATRRGAARAEPLCCASPKGIDACRPMCCKNVGGRQTA
jgi:hypothetical protein